MSAAEERRLAAEFRSKLDEGSAREKELRAHVRRVRVLRWLMWRVLERTFGSSPHDLRWWCIYARIIGRAALRLERLPIGPPWVGLVDEEAWNVFQGLTEGRLLVDEGVERLHAIFESYRAAGGSEDAPLEIGDHPAHLFRSFWVHLCQTLCPQVAQEWNARTVHAIQDRIRARTASVEIEPPTGPKTDAAIPDAERAILNHLLREGALPGTPVRIPQKQLQDPLRKSVPQGYRSVRSWLDAAMRRLRKNGLVSARKGNDGGFQLTKRGARLSAGVGSAGG